MKSSPQKLTINEEFIETFFKILISKNKYMDALYATIKSYIKKSKEQNEFIKHLTSIDKKLLHAFLTLGKLGVCNIKKLEQWGLTTDGNIVIADYGFEP